MASHEETFEEALAKIAALPRGGEMKVGTPEYERDQMIGEARQALMTKYGMAWRFRVGLWR